MTPNKILVKMNNSTATASGYQDALQSELHGHPWTPSTTSDAVCEQCQTDDYLVFEEVVRIGRTNTETPTWKEDFWCGKCEQFYGIRTIKLPRRPFRRLQTRPSR
ncbi:MAG: hypothetical protein ABWX63_12405 [Paeniglutamicibacter terrestris]